MTPEPTEEMPAEESSPRWRRRAVLTFRFVVPAIILVLILTHVELRLLWVLLREATPWLVALGIAFMPTRIIFAVLRWWQLLRPAFGRRVRYRTALRHYWVGVALGFFTPGSAGLEVYRIAALSRETGNAKVHVGVVVLEKVLALGGCAVLVLAAVPFLPQTTRAAEHSVQQIIGMAALLLALTAAGVPVIALALRTRLLSRMMSWADRLVRALKERWDGPWEDEGAPHPSALKPALAPFPLAAAFGSSVLIQVSSAVGAQIMFRAVGYDLAFSVNLFVMPLLYLLFALPVSFGSLGVREGAFIVLYGLFGVPAEVALLVSLLNLAGLMVNNLVGAAILMLTPARRDRGLPPSG